MAQWLACWAHNPRAPSSNVSPLIEVTKCSFHTLDRAAGFLTLSLSQPRRISVQEALEEHRRQWPSSSPSRVKLIATVPVPSHDRRLRRRLSPGCKRSCLFAGKPSDDQLHPGERRTRPLTPKFSQRSPLCHMPMKRSGAVVSVLNS